MAELDNIVIEELKQLIIDSYKEDNQIKQYREDIESLIKNINEKIAIEQAAIQNKTKWAVLLGNNTYSIDMSKVQNQEDKDSLKELLLQGYLKIEQILAQLNLIQPVSITVTQITKDYKYVRLADVQLTSKNLRWDKTSSKKGNTAALRLKASSFQQAIKQQKENQDFEKINNHFKNFITPFREYQKNNKTGWRINKGVLAETFERHWENAGHLQNFPYIPLQDNDIESRGRRWLMYRASSGSDPFFTGPDTLYSQVKTTRAALVSNVNTIINSLYGLLALLNDTEVTKEKVDKIFKQKQFKDFPQKIYSGLSTEVRSQLQETFQKKGFSLTS